MNKIWMTFAALLLALAACSVATCQTSPRDEVRDSQIRGNVPDEQDFDSFFKRDLAAFFKDSDKAVTVEYELLRKAPTQAGVGSPKFYAWVKVYENSVFLEEGAVRVGAVEKKEFVVIQYLPKAEIESDSERMYKLFPPSVIDKIKEKIHK
jgi:hypothetical protein